MARSSSPGRLALGGSDSSSSKFMMPPKGYRFRPTDGELVEYYLENKLRNTLQHNQQFLDVQLYDYNPDDLIAMHGDFERDQESWYFFTTRDRMSQNGSRPQRSAGDGHWRAVAADTPIVVDGVIVGYKKVLDFFIGRNTYDHERTEWKMHEYLTKDQKDRLSTPSSSQNPMQLNDCVLCKIYKNQRTLKRKRKEDSRDKYENGDDRKKRVRNHVVEVEHGDTDQVLLQRRQIEHQNTGRRQPIVQQQVYDPTNTAGEQEYYEYGGQIVEHQIQQRPDEHGYAGQIIDEHEYAGQTVEHQIQLPETNVYDDQPQYYDDGAMDFLIDMSSLYDFGQQED